MTKNTHTTSHVTDLYIHFYVHINTSKQTANICCGGEGFFGMLYLGEKPSSEDLMRVHWKFLVFLETLEGVTEWSISRPERAKVQNKGQTMISLYKWNGKTQWNSIHPSGLTPFRGYKSSLEWSYIYGLYNYQSWATVEGLWLRMKEPSRKFWTLTTVQLGA